jgi:hypothetical protein
MAQRKTSRKTASARKPSSRAQGMKVTSRIVDVRRHTKGYIAGGKKYTVAQIRKLAKSGRIKGVQVVGNHIQALPGQKRLTDLPTKVVR